jgi:hypothetical protein
MRILRDESGAMPIIEATIVFPVMILVIWFLVFMGNAYFQRTRVEAIVTELTLDGAAYCASVLTRTVDLTGRVPDFGEVKPRPYRYFTGMSEVETYIRNTLTTRLRNINTGLFSGMRPSPNVPVVKFNNYIIYSTFSVELTYRIPIPVRLLGADDIITMTVRTRSVTPVTDVPEFIRNINMIEDYLLQTGAMEEISNAVGKARDFFGGG